MNELIHPHGYWLFKDELALEREHLFDAGMSAAFAEFFQGSSVVDFGCGLGGYVRALVDAGIVACGYDGNPHTLELTRGLCQVLDLSQPVYLPRTFDWVLSLEVGEHLPVEFETVFLENLVRHCTKGMVLSWAVPTADDANSMGHVNPRQNDYIQQRMLTFGFIRDKKQEDVFRKAYTNFRCWYFRETLMVYRCQEPTP